MDSLFMFVWRRNVPRAPIFAAFNAVSLFVWLFHLVGIGRAADKLRKNLSRVCPDYTKPEMNKLMLRSLMSHFRYYAEILTEKMPTEADINARVQFVGDGANQLLNAAKKNKPSILALPHTGNWEIAGAWANLHLGKLVVVAEKLKSKQMLDEFITFREKMGMKIYHSQTKGVMKKLEEELTHKAGVGEYERGVCLAILADRDLSGNGMEVDFFADKISMPKGASLLHVKTGVPIYPSSVYYKKLSPENRRISGIKWGIVIEIAKPIEKDVTKEVSIEVDGAGEVSDGMVSADVVQGIIPESELLKINQRIALEFEKPIKKHPEDWQMMQTVFISDLDKARYAQAKAKASENEMRKVG